MTQNVILNLKSPQAIQTDIAFTQGDYGEAKLTIAVKDDEQYITGDTGASISFLRADGNIVTGELSGTQGMYGYTFAGNELETSGKTVATVTIEYDGGRVSTAAFIFTVRYNPAYDKKIPAGPYITALEKIKNQAQTYVEYLSALIEQLQPDIGSAALTKADLVNGYTQTVAGIKAFDAAAAKTLKEIVDGKIDATKIVNNLLSTDASMVLSAALGPIIDQRLTDLLEKYNRLNGELKARIMLRTIPADGATTPAAALKSHWNLFDIKSACLAYLNTTTIYAGAFVFKLSNDYGAAIIIGYDGTTVKPTYLRLNNGNWTETSL